MKTTFGGLIFLSIQSHLKVRLGKTIYLPESVVVNVFATAADVGIELLLLLFLLLVDYCCVANWNWGPKKLPHQNQFSIRVAIARDEHLGIKN